MQADTQVFLDELRRGAEEYVSYLWQLENRHSFWFTNHHNLNWEYIGERDVYVSGAIGKRGQGRTKSQRMTNKTVDGIVALWADIDIAGPGHKKTNLPDDTQAIAIIREIPFKPTFTIHSGHGYQLWWMLQSPWVFADAAEHELAQRVLQGWARNIAAIAAKHGCVVDSVFDLARIMRLPGTINAKEEDALVTVSIFEHQPEFRYNAPVDFAPWTLTKDEFESRELSEISLGEFGPELAPPADRFAALLLNDPEFSSTWHHTRRFKDDSLSSYDLALANIGVKAGWTDDEIAGLLALHRRTQGDTSTKINRRDYYERTIAKARAAFQEEASPTAILEAKTDDKILEAFSDFIGVKVLGVTKFTGKEPTYRIDIRDEHGLNHSVNLGGADAFVNQTPFRKRIFEVASVLIAPKKPTSWALNVNRLMQIATVVETGDDTSEEGQFIGLIHQYLYERPPTSGDIDSAVAAGAPVLHDGHLHVFIRPLLNWIQTETHTKMTMSELAALMRHFECLPVVLRYKNPTTKKETTTSARRLPVDLFPPTEFAAEFGTL